jgi:hypothetical protein
VVFTSDLVRLLLRQKADRCVFGHEISDSDPDPQVSDCTDQVERRAWPAPVAG